MFEKALSKKACVKKIQNNFHDADYIKKGMYSKLNWCVKNATVIAQDTVELLSLI